MTASVLTTEMVSLIRFDARHRNNCSTTSKPVIVSLDILVDGVERLKIMRKWWNTVIEA